VGFECLLVLASANGCRAMAEQDVILRDQVISITWL